MRQNIKAGARIHVSRGMDRDVIVMKYEEYGILKIFVTEIP